MNSLVAFIVRNLAVFPSVCLLAVAGGADAKFYDGRLSGVIIGTPGSWNSTPSTTKAAAFDGHSDTFFDAPNHDGAWVGLDLGAGRRVGLTKVGFSPRTDDDAKSRFSSRMVGGRFQGANTDDFRDAVDLFTISETPEQDSTTYHFITNPTPFRYVRYLSPNGSNGNVAELEFYGGQLSGTIIGTPGSWDKDPLATKEAAFDGRLDTFFDAPIRDGVWVGLDLGEGKAVHITKICFRPRTDDDVRSRFSFRMLGGRFQGANTADFRNAVDLFTIQEAPEQDKWTEQVITNPSPFRYVRYLSPDGSNGNIAELEFYGN